MKVLGSQSRRRRRVQHGHPGTGSKVPWLCCCREGRNRRLFLVVEVGIYSKPGRGEATKPVTSLRIALPPFSCLSYLDNYSPSRRLPCPTIIPLQAKVPPTSSTCSPTARAATPSDSTHTDTHSLSPRACAATHLPFPVVAALAPALLHVAFWAETQKGR
jgi:hypothetical protein